VRALNKGRKPPLFIVRFAPDAQGDQDTAVRLTGAQGKLQGSDHFFEKITLSGQGAFLQNPWKHFKKNVLSKD
jgi:hypothetical protein